MRQAFYFLFLKGFKVDAAGFYLVSPIKIVDAPYGPMLKGLGKTLMRPLFILFCRPNVDAAVIFFTNCRYLG